MAINVDIKIYGFLFFINPEIPQFIIIKTIKIYKTKKCKIIFTKVQTSKISISDNQDILFFHPCILSFIHNKTHTTKLQSNMEKGEKAKTFFETQKFPLILFWLESCTMNILGQFTIHKGVKYSFREEIAFLLHPTSLYGYFGIFFSSLLSYITNITLIHLYIYGYSALF